MLQDVWDSLALDVLQQAAGKLYESCNFPDLRIWTENN